MERRRVKTAKVLIETPSQGLVHLPAHQRITQLEVSALLNTQTFSSHIQSHIMTLFDFYITILNMIHLSVIISCVPQASKLAVVKPLLKKHQELELLKVSRC